MAFLFMQGLNLAGNLVFGEARCSASSIFDNCRPPAADRLQLYEALASALRETHCGSSVGGEQPKFLAVVEDVGHLIVKFAKRGSRMAELLPLERLALQALGSVGMSASRTQVFASAARVFLEVQRFDRTGATGRVGMLSAGSVDDEFFGQRQSWPQFAARCAQERCISAAPAPR